MSVQHGRDSWEGSAAKSRSGSDKNQTNSCSLVMGLAHYMGLHTLARKKLQTYCHLNFLHLNHCRQKCSNKGTQQKDHTLRILQDGDCLVEKAVTNKWIGLYELKTICLLNGDKKVCWDHVCCCWETEIRAWLNALGRWEEKKDRNRKDRQQKKDWHNSVLPILQGKCVRLLRRGERERRHTDGLTPSGDMSSWSPLFLILTVAVTLFWSFLMKNVGVSLILKEYKG